MTWRTVAILGGCCVLVCVALLLDRHVAAKKKPVLSFSADQVVEVAVATTTDTIKVGRTSGAWRVMYPAADVADSEAVASIVEQMAEIEAERAFPPDSPLASFGLNPPRVRVIAQGAKGELARLAFGSQTPAGTHRYAITADTAVVCLVPDRSYVRMENTVHALRSRRLVQTRPEAVDTLRYVAGDTTLTLARTGTEWFLAQPHGARADDAAVRNLLRRLGEPVVQAFLPEAARPIRASWILTVPPSAETLTVYASGADSLIVGRSGRPFALAVDTSLASLLVAEPGRWRSREVFPLSAYDVRSLEIAGSTDTLRVRHADGGGWRVGDFAADAQVVMRFIRGLESARVDTFLGEPKDWEKKAEVQLTAVGRDGEPVTLAIGPRRGEARLVAADHLGGVVLAEGLDLDSLSLLPGSWRSRRLMDLEPYQVEGITVEMNGASAAVSRHGFDRWKRRKGWAADADPDTLLETLKKAIIARFPEDEMPRPMTEVARVTLTVQESKQVLTLGHADGESLLARVDGGPPLALESDLVPHLRRCLER